MSLTSRVQADTHACTNIIHASALKNKYTQRYLKPSVLKLPFKDRISPQETKKWDKKQILSVMKEVETQSTTKHS